MTLGVPTYPEPQTGLEKGGVPGAWGAPSSSDLVPEFSGHLPVHGCDRSHGVAAQFAPSGAGQPGAGRSRQEQAGVGRSSDGDRRGLGTVGAGPWRVGAGPLGGRRRPWSKWAAVCICGSWRYSNPLEVTLQTPAIVISGHLKIFSFAFYPQ